MTIEDIARIIQLILAPVVMITSGAILVSGMVTQYAATNDRMRALARERLDLLHGPQGILTLAMAEGDSFKTERLREIDTQLPGLLRRHEAIHRAVLAIYAAILLFVASMFVIAAAAVVRTTALATAALLIFLAGTGVLLTGVLMMAIEVRTSNQAVQYEVRRVLLLGKEHASPTDHRGQAGDT